MSERIYNDTNYYIFMNIMGCRYNIRQSIGWVGGWGDTHICDKNDKQMMDFFVLISPVLPGSSEIYKQEQE
jgi:hypothetical protein